MDKNGDFPARARNLFAFSGRVWYTDKEYFQGYIMAESQRQSLFSAVQPSGAVTIGNYIGAIRNFAKLQDEYNCIYAVADLHAITVRQEAAVLRRNTLELMALFIACGIDPEKCVLFVQSHVPAHCELTWVLNTIAYPGELSRMTQFKDKSAKHADNVNMGLMDYPVLMASDILLYQAALVPVGADQKQHLELTRDLAIRFNNRYGQTFTVPDGYIPKDSGARVMSLADPSRKMSKSDENPNGFVTMSDDRDTILRKFKRAVTDSEAEVRYDPEHKPGVSNLLVIYHAFTGKPPAEAEKDFAGKGYGDFKLAVGETVADALAPIQAERVRLLADKPYLNEVMKRGAEQAARIARRTLSKVYRKVGFYSGE